MNPMSNILIGQKHESRIRVTDQYAISFLGIEDARVLATPWMITFMEITSRDAVKPFLLDSQDTVGTHVNIRHLAAAPMGSEVRFLAEITGVLDRRVTFKVDAWEGEEKIGEGTHERAIIDVAKFAERMRRRRHENAATRR